MSGDDIKLRIKLFNYVDIECNGQSIFKEKQLTSKLKSLLQYLIINRDIICKPEKIIEELWPENEYIERKKVLQTYVHRLRNALSKDNCFNYDFSEYISISNNKGSYQMEVSEDVLFDTEEFIALTRRVQETSDYTELMSLAGSMSEIYVGNYLSDIQHEQLILRQQNYYRQAYCGAQANILSKLLEMEKFHDVIILCEKFFSIEDLDDTINIIFIKALMSTQQTTYAVRHYNYIDKKMVEVFDVHPSEELTALYLSIKETQQEAHSHVKESSQISDEHIRNLVDSAIEEKIKENHTKYALAKIRVTGDLPVASFQNIIPHILTNVLRKNDMYTQINEDTVMALLHEAKEECFDSIISRISKTVKEDYARFNAKADISIWAVTNVI